MAQSIRDAFQDNLPDNQKQQSDSWGVGTRLRKRAMICTVNSVDCLGKGDDSRLSTWDGHYVETFTTLFRTAYNFNLLIVIF